MRLYNINTFLLGIVAGTCIMLFSFLLIKKDKSEEEEIIFQLEAENGKLFEELIKWEDHAIRMKRICGLPDTATWSYKQKIIHHVDLKTLESYRN